MTQDETTAGKNAQERLYADGLPFDEVRYLEAKIILQGLRFTSLQSFYDFAKIMERVAKNENVDFDPRAAHGVRPQIREVLFLDTRDFKLYNNAFILRRRMTYADGFPQGDAEIVFKFRHPDRDAAAAIDVRPRIPGNYRIKFKEEILPLKNRLGGIRSLFSHNVEFPYPALQITDPGAAETLVRIFPALVPILAGTDERVELVNHTAVEEVLQQLGTLDFGKNMIAPCNIAVWRTRGDQAQLVGEFAYQLHYTRGAEPTAKVRQRSDSFFRALQEEAKDWLQLGTTKTAVVYGLQGNPPQSHE